MITFKDFRNKTNNVLLSIYEESMFYTIGQIPTLFLLVASTDLKKQR